MPSSVTDSHDGLSVEDEWQHMNPLYPPRYLHDIEEELAAAIEMRDDAIKDSKASRKRFHELCNESPILGQKVQLGRRIASGGGCRWSLRTITARKRTTGDGGRRWLVDRLKAVQRERERARKDWCCENMLINAREDIRGLAEEYNQTYESYNRVRFVFTAEEVAHLAPISESSTSTT
ncbi:hypothetical protein PQX77_021352 [Marasmius sp. AFHP31]|nr:hypothetical protein PQX77_021352 [Marasmius sp. AFHP31]